MQDDVMFRDKPILEAARIIEQASRMVIMTGAGASTDSGMPDFRSKEGWWRQYDPTQLSTVDALEMNYDLFQAFYSTRIELLNSIKPHSGHLILADWEKQGKASCVVTQNIDQLHQLAGNINVYELHGNIRSFRCHHCNKSATKESFINKETCSCGGVLRPNIVLFGENLPEDAWNQSLESIAQADVVLVIGTSLQVYPANQLHLMTKGKRILINKEETGQESRFDVFIQGGALDCLQAIQQYLLNDL